MYLRPLVQAFALLFSGLLLNSCVYHSADWADTLWGIPSQEGTGLVPTSLPRKSDGDHRQPPPIPKIDTKSALTLPPPPLHITPEVQRELTIYRKQDGIFVRRAIGRLEAHYTSITRIMLEEGVPLELLGVAVIESGFDPNARSVSGAVGIWQFMKGTARLYGLSVGWIGDERRDPELSTKAASEHLRDLYQAYGDWYLALAAYNLGSAGVDRAIARGRSRDFWTLSRRGVFREQTRRYVPKYIAATILLREILGPDLGGAGKYG